MTAQRLAEIHEILCSDGPPTTLQNLTKLTASLCAELIIQGEQIARLRRSAARLPFGPIATDGHITIGMYDGRAALWRGAMTPPPGNIPLDELWAAYGLEFRPSDGSRFVVVGTGVALIWLEVEP